MNDAKLIELEDEIEAAFGPALVSLAERFHTNQFTPEFSRLFEAISNWQKYRREE